MAGTFIEEFAGSMGWKTEKGTAYGICQGYLFTVKSYSYGGVTYTNAWLYTQGSINSTKLGEWFLQAKSEYKIAHTPHSTVTGIEIVQHLASVDEMKRMIESLAGWLATEGAKSGCQKCGSIDENALTIIDGVPVYQCPECGGKTMLGYEPGGPPETTTAEPYVYQEGPEGIGGWLALFVVGRFLGIIITFISMISTISGRSAHILNAAGYGYIITIATLLYIISIGFDASILIFIFKKKILFRTLFVIYSAFSLAIGIGITVAMSSILGVAIPLSASLIGSIIGTVIWTIYLFASQRVKNTFTRYEKKTKNGKSDIHGFGMDAGHGGQPFGT